MSYKRKTYDEYQIECDFGNGYEYIDSGESKVNARSLLKDYRMNDRVHPYRMVKRRIKIKEEEL